MESKKLLNYKEQLKKELQSLSDKSLEVNEEHIFYLGCVHYFKVMDPIIWCDIEILKKVRKVAKQHKEK